MSQPSIIGIRVSSLAVLVVLGGTGCDPMIHARGDITVPLAVLRQFSPSQPGRLYITASNRANALEFYNGLKILCEAGPTDLVVPLVLDQGGCATEMVFTAKVSVVSQSPYPCGTGGHAPGYADSEVLVAKGVQTIFPGKTSCSDDAASVHVTVTPTVP